MGVEYVIAEHDLTPLPRQAQNKQGTGFPTRQPQPVTAPERLDYF